MLEFNLLTLNRLLKFHFSETKQNPKKKCSGKLILQSNETNLNCHYRKYFWFVFRIFDCKGKTFLDSTYCFTHSEKSSSFCELLINIETWIVNTIQRRKFIFHFEYKTLYTYCIQYTVYCIHIWIGVSGIVFWFNSKRFIKTFAIHYKKCLSLLMLLCWLLTFKHSLSTLNVIVRSLLI